MFIGVIPIWLDGRRCWLAGWRWRPLAGACARARSFPPSPILISSFHPSPVPTTRLEEEESFPPFARPLRLYTTTLAGADEKEAKERRPAPVYVRQSQRKHAHYHARQRDSHRRLIETTMVCTTTTTTTAKKATAGQRREVCRGVRRRNGSKENKNFGAASATKVAQEFSALKSVLAACSSGGEKGAGSLEDPLDVVLEAIRHIQRLEARLGAEASREAFARRRKMMMMTSMSTDLKQ